MEWTNSWYCTKRHVFYYHNPSAQYAFVPDLPAVRENINPAHKIYKEQITDWFAALLLTLSLCSADCPIHPGHIVHFHEIYWYLDICDLHFPLILCEYIHMMRHSLITGLLYPVISRNSMIYGWVSSTWFLRFFFSFAVKSVKNTQMYSLLYSRNENTCIHVPARIEYGHLQCVNLYF